MIYIGQNYRCLKQIISIFDKNENNRNLISNRTKQFAHRTTTLQVTLSRLTNIAVLKFYKKLGEKYANIFLMILDEKRPNTYFC